MTDRPLLVLLLVASVASPVAADDRTPIVCDDCDEWNAAQPPFRIFGNTYYVGTRGLAAVLLTSPAGHVLFDGALPQSVRTIEANIRALGFRVEDVRLLVNSHAHFDHAGGLAALKADTGASVVASREGASALRAGHPPLDDPQAGFGVEKNRFPPVADVRAIADGERLTVGALAITAHRTPGHTPGSTTWSWQSCEGARCVHVVYADSLNAVAAPGFRFAPIATSFAASIAKVAALPCDVLLTVHPGFGGLFEKAAAKPAGGGNAFLDKQACRAYADSARRRLDARLAEEKQAPARPSP